MAEGGVCLLCVEHEPAGCHRALLVDALRERLPACWTCSISDRVTRTGLSPLAWLDEVEQQRRAAGLRRSLRTRPPVGAELDLASNDYLGLSQHPDVIDGGVAALRTWGAGSTGSRLVTGNTELHEGFERALADFVGAESALVSPRATPPTWAPWLRCPAPVHCWCRTL